MTYWQKRLKKAQDRLDHFKTRFLANADPHLKRALLGRISFWRCQVETFKGRV